MKQNGQFRNAETLHKELTGATVAFTEPVCAQMRRTYYANCYRKHSIRCCGRRNCCHASPRKDRRRNVDHAVGQAEKVTEKNQQGQQVNATITRAISLTVPGKPLRMQYNIKQH